MMNTLLALLIAYLLGAIPFGFLLVRLWMSDELTGPLTPDGPWTRARTSLDWIRGARAAMSTDTWLLTCPSCRLTCTSDVPIGASLGI